jgi:hypothetical protein
MPTGLGHYDARTQSGVEPGPQGLLLSVRQDLCSNAWRTGLGAHAESKPKAEFAAIGEPAEVVSLQPAAINDYLNDLDRLAEIIGTDLSEGDDGLARGARGPQHS